MKLPVETVGMVSAAWRAKLACRTALGLVWCLEGLLPKWLIVSPTELARVERLGLVLGTPEITLNLIGVAEILLGIWLLSGQRERLAAWAAGLGILGFTTVAVVMELVQSSLNFFNN